MLEINIASKRAVSSLFDALGKEQASSILVHLLRNPHSTASEIAAALRIHIATAQKYLEGLEKGRLLESRVRPSKPRTAKEYRLRSTSFSINLDIEEMERQAIAEAAAAARAGAAQQADPAAIFVRERARTDVAYEWDDSGKRITAVMFFRKGLRRRMEKKVSLKDDEGRFLWHVPFQSEDFKSAAAVMEESGLRMDDRSVVEMVDKFDEMGIVSVERRKGT